MLEADELLIIGGKVIRELFPPALLGSIGGEREQQRTARSGDLVVVEQPLDLPRLQASPGPLVSADLGRRPLQRGGDGVTALALALPDLAQLRGESAAPYRRASWHSHPASLLPGATQVGHMWQVYRFYIEAIVKISPHLPLRSSVTTSARPNAGEAGEEKRLGRRRRRNWTHWEKDQDAGGGEWGPRRRRGQAQRRSNPEAEEEMV